MNAQAHEASSSVVSCWESPKVGNKEPMVGSSVDQLLLRARLMFESCGAEMLYKLILELRFPAPN